MIIDGKVAVVSKMGSADFYGVREAGVFFLCFCLWGYGLVVSTWLAPTPAHNASRFGFRSLMCTTATIALSAQFGQITVP